MRKMPPSTVKQSGNAPILRQYPKSARGLQTVSVSESVASITVEPSPTILLAEDDPVTRMLMTRFFNKAGYEVHTVTNGSQALDKMTDRYYPILVTDWEMPEMDGAALCKVVRKMHFDGYVYVLMVTSRDSKEHIIAGLEAGADDYLVKPVHEAELLARLNAGRRILNLEQSLRVANHRNRILSVTDGLTGVFNRRYLMEQLPREVERCRRYSYPLSVVMCDIDHFKSINDARGHAAGDDVLQQLVARAQKSIRNNSDWIARYGGEEFLIVLPETSNQGGMFVAEKLRTQIAATPFLTRDGESVLLTASFGVASTGLRGPNSTLDAESILRCADECLYQSKVGGRDRTSGHEIPTLPAASNV